VNFRELMRSLGSHSGRYLASGLAITVLNVISVPVYTHLFPPAVFGLYFTLSSVIQLLIVPATLSLDSAISRFYYDHATDAAGRRRYVSSYMTFGVAWCLLLILLLAAAGPWLLSRPLKVPFYPLIPLALLLTLSQSIMVFLIAILRVQIRSTYLGIMNFVNAALTLGFSIIAVFLVGHEVSARLGGQLAANLIFIVIAAHMLWKRDELVLEADRPVLKEGLRYSLPLVPHLASGWIGSLSDRLLLGLYGMRSSVGYYSVGYDLTRTTISLLSDSIFQVYNPIFMREMALAPEDFLKRHARFFTYYTLLMATAVLALSLFSPEIIAVLTPKSYAPAAVIIPIIAYAYLLGALYKPFIIILSYVKRTAMITVLGFASAFTNLGLNLLLIPRYGSTAAAWTTFGSVAVYALGACITSHRSLQVDWEYARLVTIFVSQAMAYGLFAVGSTSTHSVLGILGLKTLALSSIPLTLYVCRFFSAQELALLYQFRSPKAFLNGLLRRNV